MNRLFLTTVAGGMILLASCSQEELPSRVQPPKTEDFPISFRAGVATRVNPDLNYESNPSTFYVTAFKESHKAVNGVLPDAYFSDEPFYQMGANLYQSTSNRKWPTIEEASQVEFFAYAPSLQEIQEAAFTQLNANDPDFENSKNNYRNVIQFFNQCLSDDDLDPFQSDNYGTFADIELSKGFKLGRFYVATDISKQVDFITAHVGKAVPKNEDEAQLGVELKFKHQLSNIELKAFSANPQYNIEVAGVRIGRPYTGYAIFNFCNVAGDINNPEGGKWGISKNPQRLPVEYIYRAGDDIAHLGLFFNNNGTGVNSLVPEHTTKESAISLMGNGGNAMVLPTKNGAWAGKDNPWISTKWSADDDGKNPLQWSADNEYGDMYFSLLIRVTLRPKDDNDTKIQQIYPYGNNTTMNTVLFKKAKNSTKITGRAQTKNDVVAANEEIVEFGWAAMPVSVDWKRGTKYVYTLDFSSGVGVQDPEDPNPGTPIIGSGITFSVNVANWEPETYTPTHVPSE